MEDLDDSSDKTISSPKSGPDGVEGTLIEASGAVDILFAIAAAMAKNLKVSFSLGIGEPFKVVGKGVIDLLRDEDLPYTFIGALEIDPQTGERSFTVTSIRANYLGGRYDDIRATDIAFVYQRASKGDKLALDAISALKGSNFPRFRDKLSALRGGGELDSSSAPSMEMEFPT